MPKKRTGVHKNCLKCGKQFYVAPSKIKIVKHCSRECRKSSIAKICAICGGLFHGPRCRGESARYCSSECRIKAQTGSKWKNHQERIVLCPGCGENKKHHSRGFCHLCYNRFIWANNPKKKESDRASYWKNKEKILKQAKQYRQTLAGKLNKRRNYYSRGGKDQYNPQEVKKAIYFNFFKYGGHYCENCKIFLGDSQHWFYQVDHIHALTKGGVTKFDNLQILCQPCNLRKRGKTIDYRFRELNA